MAEPVATPEIEANGKRFTRWTRVSVTLTMESIVSGFSFEHVEPPGVSVDDVGINEGDEVKIRVDGEFVSAGYVDSVSVSETSNDGLRFAVTGRTYTKDLYDTSAQHDPGEWSDATLDTIARDLLAPYGIGLTLGEVVDTIDSEAEDVVSQRVSVPFRRVSIEPGETVADVLRRMARLRGLLLLANPDGSLAVTVAGDRTIPGQLARGQNIASGATRTGDERDRFSEYRVLGQTAGDAAWRGDKAAKSEGSAVDTQVRRYRPLVLSAEGGEADLDERARWESITRAARARSASLPVLSWYDTAGSLWRPNRVIDVQHDKLSIRGPVLISSVDLTYSGVGSIPSAVLRAVPVGAYDPLREPKTRSNRSMWASW